MGLLLLLLAAGLVRRPAGCRLDPEQLVHSNQDFELCESSLEPQFQVRQISNYLDRGCRPEVHDTEDHDAEEALPMRRHHAAKKRDQTKNTKEEERRRLQHN
jgi:hypothetical protein